MFDFLSEVPKVNPGEAVIFSGLPYSVRLNCKDGGAFYGGKDPEHRRSQPSDVLEISVIKAEKYYGTLGAYQGQWVQLFYIAAPGMNPKIIPPNTVCVSYIKKQSVSNFGGIIQEIVAGGINPATGIFQISFQKEIGKEGPYYSLKFDWRERQTDAEKKQLDVIKTFVEGNYHQLHDFDGTREMQCLKGLSAEQVEALIAGEDEPETPQLPESRKVKGK